LRKALEAFGSLWEPPSIYVCFVVIFNIFVYCLTKWYQSQKMRIKDYLYQNKLHEPLSETKPSGIKQEDWALLDRQALVSVILLSSLPDSWSGTVTVVSSTPGTNKLTFEVRRVMRRRVIGVDRDPGRNQHRRTLGTSRVGTVSKM
ncbi:hypothetical protein Tco_0976224, partial [Tanacetum coccineum]